MDGKDLILDLLKNSNLITPEQLEEAEEMSRSNSSTVIQALKKLGHIDGRAVAQTVAQNFGMDWVDLIETEVPKDVLSLIPADVARRYKVVPIRLEDNTLVVAMANPLNLDVVDNLRHLLKKDIDPVVADEDDIREAMDRYFGIAEGEVSRMLEEMSSSDIRFVQEDGSEISEREAEEGAEDEEAPVIKLVSLLILEAFRNRTSDIHLEPMGRKFRVRYRIDGHLHEIQGPPRRLQASVLSRVKIMSRMDIAEKRLPQDGRIMINVLGRELDLRVSALPSNHGESVVMRILDKEGMLISLSKLGFSSEDQRTYERLIQLPYGVLLITGPTGSGKTTTLYACLNFINRPDRKIITVEDPVEYMLPGINQVQVNDEIGLTFAYVLRSIMRQAPNVIMVGEIRDQETAEIAINAALTGHLVFSTLHTNDAPSAITRLLDIGVKPFLVASALQSVMAQRLVRQICPECKQPYTPTDWELKGMGLTKEMIADATFFHGAGCQACKNTGFRGRIGIFELMTVNDEIQKMVYQKVPSTEIRKVARQNGMKTLREDGILKVLGGVTTYPEVMNTTQKDLD